MVHSCSIENTNIIATVVWIPITTLLNTVMPDYDINNVAMTITQVGHYL